MAARVVASCKQGKGGERGRAFANQNRVSETLGLNSSLTGRSGKASGRNVRSVFG